MNGESPGVDVDARLMTWENFRTRFLEEGLPVDVPVAGQPVVTVYAAAASAYSPSGRASPP